jgi:signal transduction histidine kinase
MQQEIDRLREFAAIISHNLKTPIAGIKMLATIMRESDDPKTIKDISREIYDAIHDLQMFYREMENIFRTAHLPEDPPEPVTINEVLNEVLNQLKPLINQEKVEITTDFSEGQAILIRRISLKSILLNLLSNAIKYAKPGIPPKIHLRTTLSKKRLDLYVKDNGIGINLEKYGDKVFGLFEKFTDHPDATGMGLYIVKNQVEAMGGTIRLESKPDVGSTFIMDFPLADV